MALLCVMLVASNLSWQSHCGDSLCVVIYMKVCKELGLDKEAMSVLLHALIQ